MPEGQDPYGASAYNQRIRKEMLSAINFRRTRNAGGAWFSTTAPVFPTNGSELTSTYGSSILGGTLQSTMTFVPQYQFVMSNPITHVDRIITPALRTRIDEARRTAKNIQQNCAPSKFAPPPREESPSLFPPLPTVAAAAALPPPSGQPDVLQTAAPQTPMTNESIKPPLVAPKMSQKPPQAPGRLQSAAVVRQIPQQQRYVRFHDRASSAGSRRSSASSSDPEFVSKVAELEATLLQERENRLKVQRDLLRLEQLLESKVKAGKTK